MLSADSASTCYSFTPAASVASGSSMIPWPGLSPLLDVVPDLGYTEQEGSLFATFLFDDGARDWPWSPSLNVGTPASSAQGGAAEETLWTSGDWRQPDLSSAKWQQGPAYIRCPELESPSCGEGVTDIVFRKPGCTP
jgi:hypothetical protein